MTTEKNMPNFLPAFALDLSPAVFEQLKRSVCDKKINGSWFKLDANFGKNWLEKKVFSWYFKQGWFHVHRCDTDLENQIYEHFKPLIDKVGVKPKIRIKVTHDVRKLIPHSDAADGGDKSSVVMLIQGNNEQTDWYNAGKECKSTLRDLLKIKKVESTRFETGKCYLFNNEQVHAVSDCVPGTTRYLLAVSWQDVTFASLVGAYNTL